MAAIGEAFTTSIPPVGAAGPGYATDIDAILTEVVNRLSVKVPLSSVNFNSDLNLAGSAVLNAAYVTLVNSVVSPVSSPVNRVTSYLGDLWYVSPSGAIQLTTGATLNAAGIGGITGDYGGANPAQFRFDSVNARYDAYANFGTLTWADVRARAMDIAAGATSTVFARLMFAGGSNKTFTFPSTTPVSADRPLYMDSSGNITAGHASRHYTYGWLGGLASGNFSFGVDGTFSCTSPSTTTQCTKGLDGLVNGFRILSIDLNISKANTNLTSFTLRRNVGGTITVIGTASTSTLGLQTLTMVLGSPETVASNRTYTISLDSNGQNGDKLFSFDVVGDMQP